MTARLDPPRRAARFHMADQAGAWLALACRAFDAGLYGEAAELVGRASRLLADTAADLERLGRAGEGAP